MNSRRFFARVWRINALVIVFAGVVGVVLVVLATSMAWSELTQTHEASGVTSVAGEEIDDQKIRLSDFEELLARACFARRCSWSRSTISAPGRRQSVRCETISILTI